MAVGIGKELATLNLAPLLVSNHPSTHPLEREVSSERITLHFYILHDTSEAVT